MPSARGTALEAARAPQDSAALCAAAEAAYFAGRRDEAEGLLEKAVAADRRNARAHWLLGNVQQDAQKVDRAISSYRRALRVDKDFAEAHNDLGTAYFGKGWYAEAEQCHREALRVQPEHATAKENLATALRRQGKIKEARREYQQALVLRLRARLGRLGRFLFGKREAAPAAPAPDLQAQRAQAEALMQAGRFAEAKPLLEGLLERAPDDHVLRHRHGKALVATGDLPGGIAELEKAIVAYSSSPEYFITLGHALVGAKAHERGLECFVAALALDPGFAPAIASIGRVLHELGHFAEAEDSYRRSLQQDPERQAVYANLAGTLISLGKYEEAEKAARQALEIEPRFVHALIMLAAALLGTGRNEEAERTFQDAYRIDPRQPDLVSTYGRFLLERGELDRAMAEFQKAEALDPQDINARLSQAHVHFVREEFDAGWRLYEWRKKQMTRARAYALHPYPEWAGEPLQDKTILLTGEQGLGDEIMFASCLPPIVEQAKRCVLFCDRRLEGLFRRSFPRVEVHGGSLLGDADPFPRLEHVDVQLPVGSLPRLSRRSAADFPAHAGYLVADAAKVRKWKERIDALGAGLKVGISWRGGTPLSGQTRRTLKPEDMEPLLKVPGVRWISMQYGSCEDDIEAFRARYGVRVEHWPEAGADQDEAAALAVALDHRVSVCNTAVHLCGALGKEVWVLAPLTADWRYGRAGERMLWYPSVRLFRQQAYGRWGPVVSGVADLLRSRAAQ